MMFAASVKLFTNSMYSRICMRMRSSNCALYAVSSVATYGLMSSMRDCTRICTVKSSEFRKFWNCTMNAVCSSSDLSAKLIEEAKRIARKLPSFKTTMPSRTSDIGTKSCVDLLLFVEAEGMYELRAASVEVRDECNTRLYIVLRDFLEPRTSTLEPSAPSPPAPCVSGRPLHRRIVYPPHFPLPRRCAPRYQATPTVPGVCCRRALL